MGGSSSGGASTGGSASGGSAAGGAGTGATSATGGQGTGGVVLASCTVHDDCRAVVDLSNTCCPHPFVASLADMASNPCLVPWSHRDEPVPAGCTPNQNQACLDIPCPEFTGCAGARCIDGQCSLHDGYEGECRIPSDECPALLERYRSAIEAARACDPTADAVSCNGAAGVSNECGCPVILNEQNPELVEVAHDLRNQWDSSGCAEVTACPPIACAPAEFGTCTPEGVCVNL